MQRTEISEGNYERNQSTYHQLLGTQTHSSPLLLGYCLLSALTSFFLLVCFCYWLSVFFTSSFLCDVSLSASCCIQQRAAQSQSVSNISRRDIISIAR